MFKVLWCGRQGGATTEFTRLTKEDLEEGYTVCLIGTRAFCDKIKEKLYASFYNVLIGYFINLKHTTTQDRLDDVDFSKTVFYIENIEAINKEKLDYLSNNSRYDIICDKPIINTPFLKMEFDVARYLKNKTETSMEDLTRMLKFGIDYNKVIEYKKLNLTRQDVQFLLVESNYKTLDRLACIQKEKILGSNQNLEGILFV